MDQLPNALRSMLGATTARMYVFVIATGLLTAVALLLSPPSTVSYDVGTLADRQVKAPRSVAFVSETLTEGERERAAAAVAKVYTRSPAVVAISRDRLAQAVVNGDITQIDLEKDQRSGLVVAREILKDVEGIAFVEFNERDVVRHELVARIVRAYDRYEKK